MTSLRTRSTIPSLAHLHRLFLQILPRIEQHGRIVFRHLKCQQTREERIAEMLALAWSWFLRLHDQGKDPMQFPATIAIFAAKQVRAGRRLTGQEKGKDVMSSVAQQRHHFTVEPLPTTTQRSHEHRYSLAHGQRHQDLFEERLRDNTQTPIPEQVSFRIDFPSWVASRTERDRRVIEDLMHGERTMDVANKHGITPARISQLRRDFMEDWQRFCEPDEDLVSA